jgi:hypothetical protein
MIDHECFHDAEIMKIILQYSKKTIKFHLSGYMYPENRGGYDDIQIIFKEFKKVNLTRFDEWGNQTFYAILNIQETLLPNNLKEYKIQLTSGDVIEIHCESYEIIDEIPS